MNLYGLIGYPLTHSFSKRYFTEKFSREGIRDSAYELFELPDIAALPGLLATQPNLRGLNVTIPHKQAVIPFLDHLDESARKVGAVNVIKLAAGGKKTGYNSDYYGFRTTLVAWLGRLGVTETAALILGNGGASRAVRAALDDLRIPYQVVAREASATTLSYQQVTGELMAAFPLLINTTPLGTHPHPETFPLLPYARLTTANLLYDLVYNPAETQFLAKGAARGAGTHNGLAMLHGQAEKAWEIWQD
ncbi:MAG: shikimate dehydrogenase [Ferruginibacter sp.]|nr:shikimate dehydrogenase [Cytophagales bacterium]